VSWRLDLYQSCSRNITGSNHVKHIFNFNNDHHLSCVRLLYIFCNVYTYTKKRSENLNDSEDINRAWEKIKKDIKTTGEKSLLCV
jgi:hypothetical protein